MDSIASRIATELAVRPEQVAATVALLDEGASVPFISRYRKEVTGSLDDTQLRQLEERLRYLRELEDRRSSILASIQDQGKLTPELERDIRQAETKTGLEDLTSTSQAFTQKLYEATASEGAGQYDADAAAGATGADDDEVVDAEVIDDDEDAK